MKISGWSAASLKLTLLRQMMQIVLNPKQGTFSGCFGLSFSSLLKTRIFPDMYFWQKGVPKYHIFITLSSSEYLPTCKEWKRSSDPCKFCSWSINTIIWLEKRTCCDKLWIKNLWKLSSFHFILHSILFSVTPQLLRSFWAPQPMNDLIETVFLFWLSQDSRGTRRLSL